MLTGLAGPTQRNVHQFSGQASSGILILDHSVMENALLVGVDVGREPSALPVHMDLVTVVIGNIDYCRFVAVVLWSSVVMIRLRP